MAIQAKVVYPALAVEPAASTPPEPTADSAKPESVADNQSPHEHAVVSAVRTHLTDKIVEALADFPEHLEADFSGLLSYVISHF